MVSAVGVVQLEQRKTLQSPDGIFYYNNIAGKPKSVFFVIRFRSFRSHFRILGVTYWHASSLDREHGWTRKTEDARALLSYCSNLITVRTIITVMQVVVVVRRIRICHTLHIQFLFRRRTSHSFCDFFGTFYEIGAFFTTYFSDYVQVGRKGAPRPRFVAMLIATT